MRSLYLRALVVGALLVPFALPAQGRGPRPRAAGDSARAPRVGATQLLNARRELDLTPRQVAQLDSIERVQHARRRQFAERMREGRDSMPAPQRGRSLTPEARDSMRQRFEARREAMRPLFDEQRRADSASSAAALRLLNDTQRQRVREMDIARRAEARGRMQAMRLNGPRGQGRAFGPGRGFGPGARGFAPGERPRRFDRGFGPGVRGRELAPGAGRGMRAPGLRGDGPRRELRAPGGERPRRPADDSAAAPDSSR